MKIGFLSIVLGLIALLLLINLQIQAIGILKEVDSNESSSFIYHATTGWKIAVALVGSIGLVIGIIGIKNYQKLSSIGVVLNLVCIISVFVPFWTFFI